MKICNLRITQKKLTLGYICTPRGAAKVNYLPMDFNSKNRIW